MSYSIYPLVINIMCNRWIFCITSKQKKLLLDCMVKSKSFLNSEPYLTKEFKTSQKQKKMSKTVFFLLLFNKIFLEKQKIHTKMEIVLKANVYAHRFGRKMVIFWNWVQFFLLQLNLLLCIFFQFITIL